MLISLLLLSLLRSPRGVPATLTPYLVSTGSIPSLVASRGESATSDGDGLNMRTRYSIVQSCLLTIFACVWTAIHPNINGPRDSWWTRFKRKVTTTVIALIAPELILGWALEQRMSARRIMDKYNEEFAPTDVKPKNLTDNVFDCFRPLSQPWGDSRRWSMTHGFFIQMGGFLLFENGDPKEVLDYNRLAALLRENAIYPPTATERELQDRSKGDAISKGIVVWQTTWFALQCCVRWAQHLPLSELEVVTLAFTVVNVITYAAWWDKPQSVDTAIRVHWKHKSRYSQFKRHITPSSERQSLINDNAAFISEFEAPGRESWLRRMLREDQEKHRLPIFVLFRLPYRIILSVLHLFGKMSGPETFDGKLLRMPMFYSTNKTSTSGSITGIGIIFGAIHFIAWNSGFPSPLEQLLWRCAAIALIALPSIISCAWITSTFIHHRKHKVADTALELLKNVFLFILFLSFLLYIPARLLVIVLALKAIHNPSHAILQDVSWTSFIPHF